MTVSVVVDVHERSGGIADALARLGAGCDVRPYRRGTTPSDRGGARGDPGVSTVSARALLRRFGRSAASSPRRPKRCRPSAGIGPERVRAIREFLNLGIGEAPPHP